ncbi:tyrosine-type recombinase/integrase [Halomicroarcula sp. GCM10025324]|uniref:tyrosine-type recombinase/integrase n=1 Tax=Haloarcula TaxID=2237 RepID=UPI0023E7D97D|nr:site-specific integrase [Halomicroarcula sp. ZS-22-S1]
MTTNDPSDLEPIKPERAQELYLDHKASECREVTIQSHKYRTNHFVRWCKENGIDNLNEVSGRDLHEFRLWREEDGDLNKVSLETQMCTLRVFLKYCGSIEAVTPNLYDKLLIPQLSREEGQQDTMLEPDRAEEILSHLSRYHYASKEHVLFALLWETGMRIGAARSLDVRDVESEDECLDLVHRPETETNLKNGQGGERLVAVSRELLELLENYIEDTRIEITDDHDRSPLLSTHRGRISRPSMRRIVYTLTAPCYLDKSCPDCNDGSTKKCPEAVNPHAIRRGSITHFLTRDVPVEIVSDRMDVSRKVIDKHYDQRSEEVKVEQRRRYLDNI